MIALRIGRWIRRSGSLVALIAWLIAAPATADSERKSYRQGLEALDRGEWSEAALLMGDAIELEAQGRDRLAPLARRPYLPHYYLGVARFELGDCAGAMAAWEVSLGQKVIPAFEVHASLIERNETCRRGMSLQAETRSLLEQATTVAVYLETLGARGSTGSEAEGETASLGQRIESARQSLTDSGTALRAASTTEPETMEAAKAVATQALETLLAIRSDASRAQRSEIEATRQGVRDDLRMLIERVESRLEATEFLRSYSPRIGRQRENLESVLGTATALTPDLSTSELEILSERLHGALEEYERAVAGPPPGLYRVVDAYLAGDYEKALSSSQVISSSDARIVAHVHLLRAAALFALSQAGELEGEPLELIGDELSQVQRANPAMRPSPRVFSPRFVELFDGAVGGVRPPAE